MASWLFWTGISFILAGMISLGIALTGEGPRTFVEQIQGYSYGWIILGIGLMIYGILRKKTKGTTTRT